MLRLYFVQSGVSGPIKIGLAVDVLSRVRLLQSGNPESLVILATLSNATERLEWQMHDQFRQDCLRGEWFDPSDQLLQFIHNEAVPWDGSQVEHQRTVDRKRTVFGGERRPHKSALLNHLCSLVVADGRADRQIALAAGVHPNTFYAFMAGRRGLSVDTAEKLAVVLGREVRIVDPAAPVQPAKRHRA